MYLHVGLDKIITDETVVGIFDLDTSTVSKPTREFLASAEKNGQVENVCNDLPKSFLVCAQPDGSQKVYISQLSSQTLLKRAENGEGLNNIL